MADEFSLAINGKTYTLSPDDLELGEVELLEETMDAALEDINFGRAKAMRVLVYILARRDDPEFTMDDAARIKLGAFGQESGPAEEDKPKRPTRAAKSG